MNIFNFNFMIQHDTSGVSVRQCVYLTLSNAWLSDYLTVCVSVRLTDCLSVCSSVPPSVCLIVVPACVLFKENWCSITISKICVDHSQL